MSLGGRNDRLWQRLVVQAANTLGWQDGWQYPRMALFGEITQNLNAMSQEERIAAFVRMRQLALIVFDEGVTFCGLLQTTQADPPFQPIERRRKTQRIK